MSNDEDQNGFIHDLTVLVSDGIKEECTVKQMAQKISDYVIELKDIKNECMQ